jgi:hypothetical protein
MRPRVLNIEIQRVNVFPILFHLRRIFLCNDNGPFPLYRVCQIYLRLTPTPQTPAMRQQTHPVAAGPQKAISHQFKFNNNRFMQYKCPLCNSTLTANHYHKVIKVQERKQQVQQGELAKLQKLAAKAQAETLAVRAKAKQDVESAKTQGILHERKKGEIRNKRLMSKIRKLEEEKKILQKHTSPQEIGLADEKVLVARLQREFQSDIIQHAGKGGDVLHFVKHGHEDAGCIVYECKHTDRIATDHISQTAMAKRTRQASYGILVTTGTRKGFSGIHPRKSPQRNNPHHTRLNYSGESRPCCRPRLANGYALNPLRKPRKPQSHPQKSNFPSIYLINRPTGGMKKTNNWKKHPWTTNPPNPTNRTTRPARW